MCVEVVSARAEAGIDKRWTAGDTVQKPNVFQLVKLSGGTWPAAGQQLHLLVCVAFEIHLTQLAPQLVATHSLYCTSVLYLTAAAVRTVRIPSVWYSRHISITASELVAPVVQ